MCLYGPYTLALIICQSVGNSPIFLKIHLLPYFCTGFQKKHTIGVLGEPLLNKIDKNKFFVFCSFFVLNPIYHIRAKLSLLIILKRMWQSWIYYFLIKNKRNILFNPLNSMINL